MENGRTGEETHLAKPHTAIRREESEMDGDALEMGTVGSRRVTVRQPPPLGPPPLTNPGPIQG